AASMHWLSSCVDTSMATPSAMLSTMSAARPHRMARYRRLSVRNNDSSASMTPPNHRDPEPHECRAAGDRVKAGRLRKEGGGDPYPLFVTPCIALHRIPYSRRASGRKPDVSAI